MFSVVMITNFVVMFAHWLIPVLIISSPLTTSALHLIGVTVEPNHPRADVLINFYHDLVAEIAEIGNFSYTLRKMPAGTVYGGLVGETQPLGLIGEVYRNKSDFVIGDFSVTPERSAFVQFTRPYLKAGLAALVKRPKQNPLDPYDGTLRELLQKSKRAVVKDSPTQRYFQYSKNPLVFQLLPGSVPVGLTNVNSSEDYALISDSARIDLIVDSYCDFRSIKPKASVAEEIGTDFSVHYAIGLRHSSPFLGHFEQALNILDESGKLANLIEQHWFDQCYGSSHDDQPDVNAAGMSFQFIWFCFMHLVSIVLPVALIVL